MTPLAEGETSESPAPAAAAAETDRDNESPSSSLSVPAPAEDATPEGATPETVGAITTPPSETSSAQEAESVKSTAAAGVIMESKAGSTASTPSGLESRVSTRKASALEVKIFTQTSFPVTPLAEGETSESPAPAATEAEPTSRAKKKVAKKKRNSTITAKKKEEENKTGAAIQKTGLCFTGPRSGTNPHFGFLQGMFALPILLSPPFPSLPPPLFSLGIFRIRSLGIVRL